MLFIHHPCSVHVCCVLTSETLPVILLLLSARIARMLRPAIGQNHKNELQTPFPLKNFVFLSHDCWNRREKTDWGKKYTGSN